MRFDLNVPPPTTGSVSRVRTTVPAIGARDLQGDRAQLAPIIHDGYRIWAGRVVTAGLTAVFPFNQFGDLERCSLRPGNVHSADGWHEVLETVVDRYQDRKLRRYFRADAAFASPEVDEFLEAEGFLYAIHLPANRALREGIRLPYGQRNGG